MGTFARRLIGAAALDASVYEDIEADRSAIGQALLVVLLSSAAAGFASAAAMVTAVRHALDYRSLARTLLVCGLAALLAVGMALVLGLIFGPTAN